VHAIAALVACEARRIALFRRRRSLEEHRRRDLRVADVLGRFTVAGLTRLAGTPRRSRVGFDGVPLANGTSVSHESVET